MAPTQRRFAVSRVAGRSILATLSVLGASGCRDALHTLPGIEPLDCGGAVTTTRHRIDHLSLELGQGLDLDRDGIPDAQATDVLVSFADEIRLRAEMQARIDRRLAEDIVLGLEIERCEGDARVRLGGASVPAGGHFHAGRVQAVLGTGRMPLGMLFDAADTGATGWTAVYPLSVDLVIEGDELEGRMGGGLVPGYALEIARGAYPYFEGAPVDDPLRSAFDDDQDGVLTFEELVNDTLFTTLTQPDLDTGGDALELPDIPAEDGVLESYSFGFQIHAREVP